MARASGCMVSCLRYCKCTSFQANHNRENTLTIGQPVVCDTANVRVFKQITTFHGTTHSHPCCLRYCKCTSFQANHNISSMKACTAFVVCDTANVRVFKQITTYSIRPVTAHCCLRYCKCTSFQANHNIPPLLSIVPSVVCDTANVRVFKQITTLSISVHPEALLFAILQMYEFSSKSQPTESLSASTFGCLRYCKCTSFQANHNRSIKLKHGRRLFAILQMYEFSSKSQPAPMTYVRSSRCLRYCKCTSFQANHNPFLCVPVRLMVVCDTANVRVFKQITT